MVKRAVVIAMQQVTAYLQLLRKLRVCLFLDVVIAVVVAVALSIAFHSVFQCRGYTHIVHYQSACLLRKHPVHPGNGLHQVVFLHRLI